MNEEIYEQITKALFECEIFEEAEDVLLGMAEELAELCINDKEITYKEKTGSTELEICGSCKQNEEDEVGVYVRWLRIGKKKFEIEDYLL